MSYSQCINEIVQKSEGKISSSEAKELLKDIDNAVKKRVRDGFDEYDALREVVDERAEMALTNYTKQKVNILNNILKKEEINKRVSEWVEKDGLPLMDAIMAEIVGTEQNIKGGRDSADLNATRVANGYLSDFIGKLNNEGLLELFNSNAIRDDIAKEVWHLSEGRKGQATKNSNAQKIGEIIYGIQEDMRLRQNAAGADIDQLGGFIQHQAHDATAMWKMKKDNWVAATMPLIDPYRSFDNADNTVEALGKAWEAIITGIRFNKEDNVKLFQFSGPANLAKKVSQPRRIIFKDAESFLKYNDMLGVKDFNYGVIDGVLQSSRTIALMERYGTNPKAMLETVVTDLTKKYRGKLAENKINDIRGKAQKYIDEITGVNSIPENPSLANVGSNIRAFNNVTMLGGAGLVSIFGDTPMKAMEYQYQGHNFISAWGKAFSEIGTSFKTREEKVKWASLVGVGFENMIGQIAGRYAGPETLGKKMAGLQRLQFKLNFLSEWTDSSKASTGRTMAHHLALEKDTLYENLDADTLRLFNQYNIKQTEWDKLRKSTTTMDDGRSYIFAEGLEDKALREKLIGYYIDRAQYASPTGGAKERAILTQGTQRGTPVGEALRLITQFKQFPTTFITKIWGRTLYGKGKADIPAMMQLVLMTSIFGYLANTAQGYIKGKKPQDPTDINVLLKSVVKGGGFGILGDFFFQEYNRYGVTLTETLAGPTAGRASDIMRIGSKLIRGEDAAADAARVGLGALPFNNLFYVRPAADQIMLYQVQEMLSPGSLRRMEQREREYGGEYWLKPTDTLK